MLITLCGSAFATVKSGRFETPLRTENVVISVAGTQATITWSPVTDAASYKVYSSASPDGDFLEDLTGTFDGTSWTAPVSGDKRFYQVTSLTGGGVPPIPENFVLVVGGTFNANTAAAPFMATVSSFYIDKYEVTQSSYASVMPAGSLTTGFGEGDNFPVYYVTWYNAILYCNLRSIQEGLDPCYSYGTDGTDPSRWPTGWNSADANHTNFSCNWTANGYRLPSEVEWVFAAKGGTLSQGYTYSGSATLANVGWYSLNSGAVSHLQGTKAENELGIFDMSGNAFEWCWDISNGNYPTGPMTDYYGPETGIYRRRHGGSYALPASVCPNVSRAHNPPTTSDKNNGFRVVRNCP